MHREAAHGPLPHAYDNFAPSQLPYEPPVPLLTDAARRELEGGAWLIVLLSVVAAVAFAALVAATV